MQRRDLDAALRQVRRAEKGPAGSARDFATVTEAAILIRMGRPEPALALLGPLQGKIIDLGLARTLAPDRRASSEWRLHREISEHRMLEEVRRATVVIVNPTHVAVALTDLRGRVLAWETKKHPVRSDPRFLDLLRRMNLPQADGAGAP